jgi:hypothetical protein
MKISNTANIKQVGDLPVATSLLSTRILFFFKLKKMAELVAKLQCTNIGANNKFCRL